MTKDEYRERKWERKKLTHLHEIGPYYLLFVEKSCSDYEIAGLLLNFQIMVYRYKVDVF